MGRQAFGQRIAAGEPELARRLGFKDRTGQPAVERFMKRVRLLEFAPSFGDVATSGDLLGT